MPTYFVLLGPPGAGKGTQASRISKEFDLAHVSSGDIFRENLKNQTELGKLAQDFMNRGELVPDDITIQMIQERLSRPDCQKGALLDGFPRTPDQARALDDMLKSFGGKVNYVPYIKVEEKILEERLTGRRVCRENGHVYHIIYNPPKVAGKCDQDGSDLYQRDDDKPETVRRRIQVYLDQTSPLIEFYNQKSLLIEVDGSQDIEKVSEIIIGAIKEVV